MTDTLSIREFGTRLIMTGDLDPVYVALHGAQLKKPQLMRWLLAYWCFYHMGVASWLSAFEGDRFWGLMMEAARNETPSPLLGRWPRASERRYFRGPKCVAAVKWLWDTYQDPEFPVQQVIEMSHGSIAPRSEKDVMREVEKWPLFGPWISFKAADMLERCAGVDVQFSEDIGLIYSEPRASLDLLLEEGYGSTAEDCYARLKQELAALPAPPARDRGVGPQELETVLCKHKSHRAGRYTVGKDILEVRHALAGWGTTADRLLAACPEVVR